jgi:ketosteroid isomerase-like protein
VSEENVELVRGFVDIWNERDVEAIIERCDRDIVVQSSFAQLVAPRIRVTRGCAPTTETLRTPGMSSIVEPEAYFDLGQQMLGFAVLQGRGRRNGAKVTMRIATVTRWRDGLAVYFASYVDRDQALRDLGVSEDKLEAIPP